MILRIFSWQQFLIAALIFAAVWYAVMAFIFFRKQFNSRRKPQKLHNDWDQELQDDPDDNLMGEQTLPEGISQVEAHGVSFTAGITRFNEEDKRDTQLGLVADVLEELRSIFYILERDNGSKEDLISLFGQIKTKYGHIAGTTNEAAIGEYIRENVLFPISDEELANLWK